MKSKAHLRECLDTEFSWVSFLKKKCFLTKIHSADEVGRWEIERMVAKGITVCYDNPWRIA